MVLADGAPGLIKAVEHCWPASDRQYCAVHRLRNLVAKLPESESERIRAAYWQALDEATDEREAKQRLAAVVDGLVKAADSAAAICLSETSTRSSSTCATRGDTAGTGEGQTCSSDHRAR